MGVDALQQLVTQLAAVESKGKMRFSLCMERGWVASNNEEAIRLLCEVWNHRAEIAALIGKGKDFLP